MKSHLGFALLAVVFLVAGCKRQPPPDVPNPPSVTNEAPASPEAPAAPATPSATAPTNSKTSQSSGNPITAPVDYLGAVAQGQQVAMKQLDFAQVQHAIQQFSAGEGRNPKDLNELVSEGYLVKVPALPRGMQYSYDPAQGTVSVVRK